MARRVRTGVAAVVTALFIASNAQGGSDAHLSRAELSLLTAMNEVRLQHGLQPLTSDARLERAARAHSSKMLRVDRLFHGAFTARIRRVGVRAPRVGENLAWGTGSLSAARAIVRMWLGSPPHRANLLHAGYRTVGVGALRGSFAGQPNALMVTTDFAGR